MALGKLAQETKQEGEWSRRQGTDLVLSAFSSVSPSGWQDSLHFSQPRGPLRLEQTIFTRASARVLCSSCLDALLSLLGFSQFWPSFKTQLTLP